MTRGVKPLSRRDWLFGSRPRRLAIAALLAEPCRAWSKSDLARAAGVGAHGGIDEHVRGFCEIGLLVADGRLWRLPEPEGDLVRDLRQLLRSLELLPDTR